MTNGWVSPLRRVGEHERRVSSDDMIWRLRAGTATVAGRDGSDDCCVDDCCVLDYFPLRFGIVIIIVAHYVPAASALGVGGGHNSTCTNTVSSINVRCMPASPVAW